MQRTTALLFFTAFFLTLCNPAFGDRYLIEGRVGHFRPFSSKLRDRHDSGWDDYQFEMSYSPFSCSDSRWWSNLFIFGNYTFIFNRGITFSGFDDTEIVTYLNSASLGLKYIQPLPWCFSVYGSAGGRYIWLESKNKNDPTVADKERARGLGGVFGLGFLFFPIDFIAIDLFTNVTIKHFDESNFSKDKGGHEFERSVDVSGITFGIGGGFRF